MTSLSRLFVALVTLSVIGLACATSGSATSSSSVEDVPNENSSESAPPQTPLQKLTAPEGFTVLFPGTPAAQRSKVPVPGGEVLTAAWSADDNGILYSISTLDYPESVVAARPAADFFAGGKAQLVNKLSGTLKSEENITLQGYPGQALTISSDSGEVRARNYLVGARLYTLLVRYNPSIGAPQADQFLGSLELINPPASISPVPRSSADAGTPGGDGGMPSSDAGMPSTDAGTPGMDGGTRPRK
jgi:hypothetical protein